MSGDNLLFSKMMMTPAMTIMNLITKMLSNEIELSAFALPTFQGEQWRAFRIKIIIIGVIITTIIMVALIEIIIMATIIIMPLLFQPFKWNNGELFGF